MANYKSILIAACIVMLTGCGGAAQTSPEPEKITPKDARTGTTFETQNKLLEAVKAQRPFEYDVVFSVTKDSQKAMDSYVKYNASTNDEFPKPVYVDFSGREISKEDFDKVLESRKLGQGYENVITDYFKNIELGLYEKSFAMVEPKSNFQQSVGYDEKSFESSAKSIKAVSRVTDVLPIHYKLVDQGGVLLMEVAFKTMAFWAPSVMEGLPDEMQKQIEKDNANEMNRQLSSNKPPSELTTPPNADGSTKKVETDWNYHMSNSVKFRLVYQGGSWLIHDQY